MLFIFVLYSTSNALQWIQYSIISNVITKYYNVTSYWVDWTSMIYMITYIPLIFPASWVLSKYGLRTACIIGATGNCLGAWIKVASADPGMFNVTFIGQTIVAVSQVFVLSVPARLAAVWFGADEVSSACSIGVFGNQLGIALGFLFPPMIVRDHEDVDLITRDLKFLYYSIAVFTSFVFILILAAFQSAPSLPPSRAQASRLEDESSFSSSMQKLFFNRGYMLLLISYGIMVGVFYAISTLLNQIILQFFPGHELDAGRIGLTIVVAGMLGSVLCGFILDKTHHFKYVTLGIYCLSFLGMLSFMFTIDLGSIVLVYVVSGGLGFFMTGYLPVGFEFAAELTYPEPEGTSAGLLNASSQVFGIIFTIFYAHLYKDYGQRISDGVMSACLALGFIMTLMIRENLKRQKARLKTTTAATKNIKT
ncbi:conserved hypothetical protein [Pediculus humanus corporis]|uniref:Choline/ethanolamine transporter FLVCR1 n=1 Tax=Pediculus humanus subsp. corporis TaxID=121224 RepID=E0VBJ3_PEDHC|nr:uncharacterized protein Phum_PHUM062660 [Pediculus humanus corporis]EEB10749.1 conserved hypothetical protein [Pediculus humanus corporis]